MANKIEKQGKLPCLLALGTACIWATNSYTQTADRKTAAPGPDNYAVGIPNAEISTGNGRIIQNRH